MGYYQSPYDVKKTLKQMLIYLLIALPFIAIVAVGLTILKVDPLVIMLCNVVTGGIVVCICYVVHSKIKAKKEQEQIGKPKKFDPFKD